MSKSIPTTPNTVPTQNLYQSTAFNKRLQKRYRIEKRFKWFCIVIICLVIGVLCLLLGKIVNDGYSAFWRHQIQLSITFDPQVIDPSETRNPQTLRQANYDLLIRKALHTLFPEVTSRRERLKLYRIVSGNAAFILQKEVMNNPEIIGTTTTIWVPTDDHVDQFLKGHISCGPSFEERQRGLECSIPEGRRKLNDQQVSWVDRLKVKGYITSTFNSTFFTSGDSRDPESAGLLGSLVGSLMSLSICLLFTLPIAIGTAIYLEEFAAQNWLTKVTEISISNLMAVPSIVFGLLGLSLFLNFMDLPRSAPLVAGMVLALMTLPIVIVSTRASLKTVPLSIREAALGLGASQHQTVFHHVLPLAKSGIFTGTIIGMSQALGETAPLLMIGMVAFIVEIPQSFLDPATVLPVQIYLWSDSPERGFIELTSAAIIILLGFLLIMNALAIYLRKKFEYRW